MLDESKINYRILKIPFMKKDFIENYNSNYEIYLNEFVNNSKFVTDKGNFKFKLTECQSNNEPDATNGIYNIEYKLFIDTETLLNKNWYSQNITIYTNGVRAYGISKKQGKYTIVNLKCLISKYSLNDFNMLKNKQNPNKEEAKVKRFLEKLEIDKNIMFLIPNIYYYDGQKVTDESLEFIINKFSTDFYSSIKYRKQYANKDTYIAFFIEDYIIFTKEINLKLFLYDKVKMNSSHTFKELNDISYPFDF